MILPERFRSMSFVVFLCREIERGLPKRKLQLSSIFRNGEENMLCITIIVYQSLKFIEHKCINHTTL